MLTKTTRRVLLGLLAGAALYIPSLAVAADDYPSKPLEIIVPSGPSGSLDRMARTMAPFLSKELGQPVTIVNRPGGTGILGHQALLQSPSDGYTLLASPVTYLINFVALDRVPFTLEDFAYINAQWVDFGVLMVPKDKPYKSLDDLVAAIKAEPGKVTTAGLVQSDNQINLAVLLDRIGLKYEDVRFVAYQGGGELRAAIAGGQVDFAISGAEGSEGIRDFVHPLAVFRAEGNEMWDAPQINDLLTKYDAEVPYFPGSMRSFLTTRAFREDHPDRWKKLVTAFQHVLEDSEALAALGQAGIGTDWVGPEKTEELVREASEVMTPFIKKLAENQ